MVKFGKHQTKSMHNETKSKNRFLLYEILNFIIRILRSERQNKHHEIYKIHPPANTLFYPLYAHIWYPICFGHSSESLFVCITEWSILLKWSLDGQHIIKQICLMNLGMICLVIKYNLVKKNFKNLNNKIWRFPISYTELPITNKLHILSSKMVVFIHSFIFTFIVKQL